MVFLHPQRTRTNAHAIQAASPALLSSSGMGVDCIEFDKKCSFPIATLPFVMINRLK